MAIEKHYTAHQLAELLGLDYETVLQLAQVGEIASVRVGRLRRFPESAVRAYLNRQADNVISLRRPTVAPPPKKEASNDVDP
jgi:excisionase family DNA binding protein